ncbi:malonyl-CoA decarboxylase [Sulfitobacter delicatus]|uniref:Malonyl-CoA decarboxylase n=1 Tax=Sulfitobacter delicatus TaxID=218672 RepID=A0A1G7PAC2_9RHOB|nr:malonyl-CoA decarboxylase [Sulfitobacter delicatus]SDF83067.1 malonyl-CoA decarboxylase [Sulfitobacter delicatus]
MSLLADLLSTVFDRSRRAVPAGQWDNRAMEELVADLIGNRGEVRGMILARQILDRYAAMTQEEKRGFFLHLATGLDINPDRVRSTLQDYETASSKASYRAFMAASEPPRQELVRRLNQVPGATGSLVAMRNDLLAMTREEPTLAAVDLDFRHLFSSWFNRGFLVLRPINWESPAHVLEKIIAYEAVHAIDSWDDLRRRMQPTDRRCFAFFHPAMPDEPLIFVEVALTKGVPGAISQVLTEDRDVLKAEEADTAVFYSISNCQAGLAGISFGNSLIKQVVDDLSRELPGLKTFVTLSPIPGLTAWLEEEGVSEETARANLAPLTARYLLQAKRPGGAPRDPVARFHLGNGAMVHAVHAEADPSTNGQKQSFGAMVNYLYDLSAVAQNHERFADSHEVAAAPSVVALARAAEKAAEKAGDKTDTKGAK